MALSSFYDTDEPLIKLMLLCRVHLMGLLKSVKSFCSSTSNRLIYYFCSNGKDTNRFHTSRLNAKLGGKKKYEIKL